LYFCLDLSLENLFLLENFESISLEVDQTGSENGSLLEQEAHEGLNFFGSVHLLLGSIRRFAGVPQKESGEEILFGFFVLVGAHDSSGVQASQHIWDACRDGDTIRSLSSHHSGQALELLSHHGHSSIVDLIARPGVFFCVHLFIAFVKSSDMRKKASSQALTSAG